jgi:hypothetical protein
VVGHRTKEFAAAVKGAGDGKAIVDLARLFDSVPDGPGYEGINW